MNKIYTIGYAGQTLESFVKPLKKFDIKTVIDVRSSPYSSFKPEFNREALESQISLQGIKYLFLGDNCGARVNASECYVNGVADYDLIASHGIFKAGLARIYEEVKNNNIALMCAESDPINCHRCILVARNIALDNCEISHIISDGTIQSQGDIEKRLLKMFKLDSLDLFKSEEKRIREAYQKQAAKIAYRKDSQPTYVYEPY